MHAEETNAALHNGTVHSRKKEANLTLMLSQALIRLY